MPAKTESLTSSRAHPCIPQVKKMCNPPPRVPPGLHVTVLNAGSGDQIQPAVGEDFLGRTEESGTTGSLRVWGRGASNSLVPSGGPSLHVAVGDAWLLPSSRPGCARLPSHFFIFFKEMCK